jgi:hypothetical protein
VLPSWLPEITLERLRVGGATATIRFCATGISEATRKSSTCAEPCTCCAQPAPESQTVTTRDRVAALVDGLVHS